MEFIFGKGQPAALSKILTFSFLVFINFNYSSGRLISRTGCFSVDCLITTNLYTTLNNFPKDTQWGMKICQYPIDSASIDSKYSF